MGTSRNATELGLKLRKAGGAIDGAAKDGVRKAALLVKTSVVSEMGGVKSLRGVGRKGARIGVRFDVKGTGNPTALVRATGPFHLLERDTKPHEITPKRKQALKIGRGFASSVWHPGTRGKHPWEKGINHAKPLVPRVMADEQFRSLRRFFG